MADTLQAKYVASMVLSGVGDAMGYKNGSWEFSHSGQSIHSECEQLGGVAALNIKLPEFCVSDDTVMHLATADGLIASGDNIADKETMYSNIAAKYVDCMDDMTGRAPGLTSSSSCHKLKPQIKEGWQIPFNSRGGGCGAAMRAMCIGLRFPGPEMLDELIAVSCECGRMTHHNPTGFLGSLASALFTAYSIQGKPVREWGAGLMSVLPTALEYIRREGRYADENANAWDYFQSKWQNYLTDRGIADGQSEPQFPEIYGIEERDAYYESLSFDGWGGASGHDAPMIAYDALLAAGEDWVKLCHHAVLHSGDSDSTGVIAAACYGAMYGIDNVPTNNHSDLEYRSRLVKCAEQLYKLSR